MNKGPIRFAPLARIIALASVPALVVVALAALSFPWRTPARAQQQVGQAEPDPRQPGSAFRTFRLVAEENASGEIIGRGRVSLTLDVEAWQGRKMPVLTNEAGVPIRNAANHPVPFMPNQRHLFARVEVFSSEEDRVAGRPKAKVDSNAVELPRGETGPDGVLYEESIPFDVPVPARDEPYIVVISLQSGDPVLRQHDTGRITNASEHKMKVVRARVD